MVSILEDRYSIQDDGRSGSLRFGAEIAGILGQRPFVQIHCRFEMTFGVRLIKECC